MTQSIYLPAGVTDQDIEDHFGACPTEGMTDAEIIQEWLDDNTKDQLGLCIDAIIESFYDFEACNNLISDLINGESISTDQKVYALIAERLIDQLKENATAHVARNREA